MKMISLLSASMLALVSTAYAQDAKPAAEGGAHPRAEKMKERMKEHHEKKWKEMDTDGDGSISKEESAAFHSKGFDEKDANKDGKISKEEAKAFREKKRAEYKAKHGAKHDDKTHEEHAQ
jgi:hypothetical protein